MSKTIEWANNNFIENPPFSFIYDGKYSKEFLNKWKISEKSEKLSDTKIKNIFLYDDSKTNLKIFCEATIYEDFPAVEWVLYFKNNGKINTPIIEDILALNCNFSSSGEYNIHQSTGVTSTINDFKPICTSISKGMVLSAGCIGGRSSNGGYPPAKTGGVLPFFNLEDGEAARGIMVGVGWTGQWMTSFYHETDSTINIKSGMEITHLKLLPGEQIRTPSILLLFWEGSDYLIGNNLLRKFIISHKLPRINGKPIEVPIAANSNLNDIVIGPSVEMRGAKGDHHTESSQIEQARRCKELGIEYYWLDAGWHTGGFPKGVGSWTPDKRGFPDGFRNLSKTLKEMNLKFILWFEIERVNPGTQLWNDHPEWLLGPMLPSALNWLERDINWTDTVDVSKKRECKLLNMGNKDARQWLTDHISKMITENGIDVFRQDCNIDPLEIWRANDPEDRQGITEIRHIEGLYAFWDELLNRHPGLIIDSVASGDRRIDIETIARSVSITRTDYAYGTIGAQCHTYGLSLYMPGNVGNAATTVPDKYDFRGLLSGGAAIFWDLKKKDFPDKIAINLINEVRELQPVFYGDFWPLTPYSLSENCWIAWQFDRKDLGIGAVYAFRRSKSASNTIKLYLKGIKKETKYEINFVDKAISKKITGKEIIERGIELKENNAPESILITYKSIV